MGEQNTSKNCLYLNGIMNEFIVDEIEKRVQGRKLRSKSEIVEEEYVSIPMLRDLLQTVFGKWNSEVAHIMETVEKTAEEECNKKCNKKQKEFDEFKKVIMDENVELRNQVDNASQYTRRDNIKIVGIPVTENEDVSKIVIAVAKHNGVNLEEKDISIAHRINTKDDREDPTEVNTQGRKKKIPSIICRLVNRTKKAEIIDTKRQIKMKPDAPYPEAAIYEDVTPLRSRMLFALRNKMESDGKKKFKFVWTRDGRICARTEEESQRKNESGQPAQPRPHFINTPQDLLKEGWNAQEVHDIIHNIRAV